MSRRLRQLSLDLRSPARWGGARPGAGRKRGPRARNAHRRRAPISRHHPCHVTLRSARLVSEFERSLRESCERGRFRVVHYALMRDHVHALVEAASASDLAAGMKSLGSRLARAVNRVFGRRGAVLADRYHVHVLRTPREVRAAIAYVLLNARRHAAKLGRALTARWRIDPASSGRWFDGWRGGVPARPACDVPAVARARSWLLAMGWRRAGLVDPVEVPGRSVRTRGKKTGVAGQRASSL